jgi:hypothetical protein
MGWAGWLVVALSTLNAGWMAFDGIRAMVVGDYVTPKSGDYAGQLGPWHHLASAVGIGPRSTLMKAIFVAYGLAWLVIIGYYAAGAPWARGAMIAAAALSLWYLVVGTLVSAIVLVLLFTLAA